jgi:hypothetical protein
MSKGSDPSARTVAAEVVALQALTWLASDPDRMAEFLAATGASGADLALQAREATFLAAVLDHLLSDEKRVIAFCDSTGLPYEAPLQARAALPGGDLPSWT